MKNFNYQKICSDLISNLEGRQKEIICRRFGLNEGERETLESIGKDFGICRERVRQIQEDALGKIRTKLNGYEKVFDAFLEYFKKFGNFKKEDILLNELGQKKFKNHVYFLLTLKGEPFQRLNETDKFYSLWFVDKSSIQSAESILNFLYNQLQKTGQPVKFNDLEFPFPLKKEVALSYLEVFKEIEKNDEGVYGLKEWPEINPRGIKDKAYLVLKKLGKPLHFSQVAHLIEGSHLQTVHNELIRDSKFVLVGRGIYALREWGYSPGQVKDVISEILKQEKKPLTKEEILEKVSRQRMVKTNTILLNLSNKKYFERDSQGRYTIKEA